MADVTQIGFRNRNVMAYTDSSTGISWDLECLLKYLQMVVGAVVGDESPSRSDRSRSFIPCVVCFRSLLFILESETAFETQGLIEGPREREWGPLSVIRTFEQHTVAPLHNWYLGKLSHPDNEQTEDRRFESALIVLSGTDFSSDLTEYISAAVLVLIIR
jgi:hypothetical protein